MNILVPYKWLQEHLDTNATPVDIQRCLSLCGPSVERIYEREGDSVFDIEVTTNRVDSASVRGIAREAVAILPEFGFTATLKPLPKVNLKTTAGKLDLVIENDPKLCHRIVTVKLSQIKLGPSPDWLQTRLRQIDLRPINNAVDITNYIMWDVGHPIHAFDYDRLTKKKIIVRFAKKGEVIITLDEIKHTLNGGEVVFDDGTGTIDLPGIMGTANTVVTDKTKNVLLWIESVDPVKIRQASMGLGLRSQAAVLNEKRVDPQLASEALAQAIGHFQSLAHATIGSQLVDIYPKPTQPQITTLTQTKLDTYLGLKLKPARITSILESLGCTVKASKDSYQITPPSSRSADLSIPEDYIEEIARIYGYHNLPSVVMPTAIPDHPPVDNFSFEHQLKQWLAGWGATEVYTYSMLSKALATQSGFSLKEHLVITNPLSDDWVYLRRSLLPSMMEVVKNNPTHEKITLFELQNVYHPTANNLPHEELRLTLVSTNSYTHLVGLLDSLLSRCNVSDITITPQKTAKAPFTKAGSIISQNETIGTIGLLDDHYFGLELLIKPLQAQATTHPHTLLLSTYPPVIEDLTFTVPAKQHVGPLISSIKALDPIIESVELKDIYHQNHTLTLTYRSPKQNLTTDMVAPVRKKIVHLLEDQFHAKLVGELK